MDDKKKKNIDSNGPDLMLELVDLETGTPSKELRAGDLCPKCREGRLDYDGLLNLACPKCGYALGGCFT